MENRTIVFDELDIVAEDRKQGLIAISAALFLLLIGAIYGKSNNH